MQVAELRQKILELWVGSFETSDTSQGGCPAVPSNNVPDPPETAAPFGVAKLDLFMRGTSTATDMTNRNSVDSKAMVLEALYKTARVNICTDSGMDTCGLPAESILVGGEGVVVTAVAVEVNTFFGQVIAWFGTNAARLTRPLIDECVRWDTVRRVSKGCERQRVALRGRLAVLVRET